MVFVVMTTVGVVTTAEVVTTVGCQLRQAERSGVAVHAIASEPFASVGMRIGKERIFDMHMHFGRYICVYIRI